ncbi:EMI1 family protein [Aspergillus stella-maris]|uniref:EMI1 family protein n=1 Tax=Aspergillus stella-maris TaxID=1810926 RepID=UPI003CCCCF5D
MGWLWNSSSSKKDESQSTQSTPPLPETLPLPQPEQAPRKLTREEQADAEFSQLWESLKSDVNKADKSAQSSSASTAVTAAATQSTPQSPNPSVPASIAPESLYADEMSCRSAFDYAFFCQSLGGQFVNVYRYGEMRSCSEHWENFWVCMKTRTAGDVERRRAIREHNRKKAIKYRTGPSSEDVWDIRMEPVKDAFQGDFNTMWESLMEEDAER